MTGSVEAMILDVAQEVFEVDVLAKRERLAATEACVQGLRCRQFFQVRPQFDEACCLQQPIASE